MNNIQTHMQIQPNLITYHHRYKGISVTSHSPCRHRNTPVADGSCAGGHVGPGYALLP